MAADLTKHLFIIFAIGPTGNDKLVHWNLRKILGGNIENCIQLILFVFRLVGSVGTTISVCKQADIITRENNENFVFFFAKYSTWNFTKLVKTNYCVHVVSTSKKVIQGVLH